MAVVTVRFGSGHAQLAPGGNQGTPSLVTVLRDGIDDVTELHTRFIALLAQLDADGGITDTDYEATHTPDDLLNTKG